MRRIAIIGAGMMGSALAFPARENGHDVLLVGTPLDREIIDHCRKCGRHPKFDSPFPEGIRYFQFEEWEQAVSDVDFVIGGPCTSYELVFHDHSEVAFCGEDEAVLRMMKEAMATGLPYGGGLSDTLSALTESDFILRYTPYGEKGAVERYKLIDNFCLFWVKFVESQKEDGSFMTDSVTSDIMKGWRGIAFEEVC